MSDGENNLLDQLVPEMNESESNSSTEEEEEEEAAPSAPRVRRRIRKTNRRSSLGTTQRQTTNDSGGGVNADAAISLFEHMANMTAISSRSAVTMRRSTRRNATALSRAGAGASARAPSRPLSNELRGCRHCICTVLNGRVYKLLDLPYLQLKRVRSRRSRTS
ncbi:uncharacterized protein LOC108606669 [Drosophila busckii]|uniref:uncharacterized protein LOC108606669 n=1 Tax=Drosophila busckii TaxID=30019 RepID=UPI00083EB448|nr:uncharacterized protein LOC108606669 [Drosophila busckii]